MTKPIKPKLQSSGAAVLRKDAALDYTGLRATQFDELVILGPDKGGLPAPIRLSPDGKTVGWVRRELDAWMEARIAKRDAARK